VSERDSLRRQLRMLRPHLDDLPDVVVPAGYGLRSYRPGDERPWGEIMESDGGIGVDWTVAKVRRQLIEEAPFEPAGLLFATCDAEGGRVVASACAWRPAGTADRRALPGGGVRLADYQPLGNVHMVCALMEHRGKGLGRLVCLAVLHYLRDRGDVAAELSTDDFRLSAIRTYLGLGFVPVYLTATADRDDHESRWSAVFARLGDGERDRPIVPAGAARGAGGR
jgi:mycothiol synthase